MYFINDDMIAILIVTQNLYQVNFTDKLVMQPLIIKPIKPHEHFDNTCINIKYV